MGQFLKPGKEPTFKQNIVVNKEDAGGRCPVLQYASFTFPYFLIKRITPKKKGGRGVGNKFERHQEK